MRFVVQLVILQLALHCTNAKRLKLRVDELERVLEEQRLVNQQQTLIILELVKATNIDVNDVQFSRNRRFNELRITRNILSLLMNTQGYEANDQAATSSSSIKRLLSPFAPSTMKTSELEDKYDYLNDRLETQLASIDARLDETRDMARVRLEEAWSNWSEWSKCSVTCQIGSQYRHRHCNGDQKCRGSGHKQRKKCGGKLHLCDTHWAEWGHYSTCSKSCGAGIKTRERACLHYVNGTDKCNELDRTQSVLCNTHNCDGILVFGGDNYRNLSHIIDPAGYNIMPRVGYPIEPEGTDFWGSCASVFRDKVVVVGHINTARRGKAFVLDVDRWRALPDLRHHRNGAACAVYQDRMVVCAGGNANGGQTCEMLPPHMKLWDDFPSTLAYRSWNPGMAATSWGLVLAGSYYSSSTSEILVDRRIGWKYGPNLDIGIGSTVAVTLNDKAYIVGGYQNFDYSRVYLLAGIDKKWQLAGDLKRVRYYHSACAIKNQIWIFGGHSNETNVVEVFDVKKGVSEDTNIVFNTTDGMKYPSSVLINVNE